MPDARKRIPVQGEATTPEDRGTIEDHSGALCSGAIDKYNTGRIDDAIADLETAINGDPGLLSARLLLADMLSDLGRQKDAYSLLAECVRTHPDNAAVFFALGNVCRISGDAASAEKHYLHALSIDPAHAAAHNNLGILLNVPGRENQALAHLQKAVALDSAMGEAYYNMGNVLLRLGQQERAIACFKRAAKVNPNEHRALNHLGNLYLNSGDIASARLFYGQALKACPTSYEAHHNMGNVLRAEGRVLESIDRYRHSLMLKPDSDKVLVSLGNACRTLNRMNDAIDAYQTAIEYNPQSLAALNNLGIVFGDLGMTENALDCFDRMLSIREELSTEIKKAMTLPIIYPSTAAMMAERSRFLNTLTELGRRDETVADPYQAIGMSNFILALHGVDEKDIRQKIARFYINTCPTLEWRPPGGTESHRGRIRMGIVCKYLYDHTIGRLYHGLIEKFDKAKFQLILFRFGPPPDALARQIDNHADSVVNLPNDLFLARQMIAEQRLDVLFYPEIGMDPLTYYIAFSRLAPVQCKRGFQITSGIPNMDFFISSSAAEPTNGQDHYTEDLVKLNGTGYYYKRPPKPSTIPSRADYGLPEQATLYACPQSLFKIHPDFDSVIKALLDADPKGILILIDGLYPHWKSQIRNRFKESLSGHLDRIVFLPRMNREKFMALALVADAMIDTIYFSGGNTSLECFAWGVPVVTWPSARLPGRLTYGFYRMMGVLDCVADSADSYVRIAIRLANEPQWKAEIGERIRKHSTVLFENIEDVRELERFFESAVKNVPIAMRSPGATR